MSVKLVDFTPVRDLEAATQERPQGRLRAFCRSPNGWLYFVLLLLVLACLTFAAVVWSILLSPIT